MFTSLARRRITRGLSTVAAAGAALPHPAWPGGYGRHPVLEPAGLHPLGGGLSVGAPKQALRVQVVVGADTGLMPLRQGMVHI